VIVTPEIRRTRNHQACFEEPKGEKAMWEKILRGENAWFRTKKVYREGRGGVWRGGKRQ